MKVKFNDPINKIKLSLFLSLESFLKFQYGHERLSTIGHFPSNGQIDWQENCCESSRVIKRYENYFYITDIMKEFSIRCNFPFLHSFITFIAT
jgi:hypothetical protein